MAADHVIENDLLNDTTGNYCSVSFTTQDFVHKLKSYISIELSHHSILEANTQVTKKKDRTPPKETTAVQLCSFRRLWKQSPVIFFRTTYPVYSRTNETAQTKETLDTSSIFKLTAQGTREAFSGAEILDQSRQASASLHVRIV